MRALPPPWALGALALHAEDDPHLVDGVHYRLFSDPRLGLPMRPVHVWRTNLGPHAQRATGWLPDFPPLRHEVTWTDARGQTVVAPFTVTPDNPVTGLLPTNALSRAIWLRVETAPDADVRADIFRSTARGPRLLGARDAEPLSLGGSAIDGVIVSGSGVVRDLTWLDVWRLALTWDELNVMALPRDNRPRYADPRNVDNLVQASNRVRRGAPPHVGLHDEPTAADAFSTSASDADDEAAKLTALAPTVSDALDALLDDLSAPQHRLTRVEELTEGDSTVTPEATYLPIDLVHTAMLEPTLARWLGFMDVDDFQPNPDDVVVYQLWSWWAIDRAALSPAEIVSFLPAVIGLVTDVNDDNEPAGPTFDESPDGLPIFQLWLPAVAVGHAPPLRPEAPVVGAELAPTYPGHQRRARTVVARRAAGRKASGDGPAQRPRASGGVGVRHAAGRPHHGCQRAGPRSQERLRRSGLAPRAGRAGQVSAAGRRAAHASRRASRWVHRACCAVRRVRSLERVVRTCARAEASTCAPRAGVRRVVHDRRPGHGHLDAALGIARGTGAGPSRGIAGAGLTSAGPDPADRHGWRRDVHGRSRRGRCAG